MVGRLKCPYNLRNSTLTRQTPQGPPAISDRARLLHVLDAAEGDALTNGDLRERGIEMPGQAIYELELDGYPAERARPRGSERRGRVLGYRLSAHAADPHDRANPRRDV